MARSAQEQSKTKLTLKISPVRGLGTSGVQVPAGASGDGCCRATQGGSCKINCTG
jgi:hypothetical protein